MRKTLLSLATLCCGVLATMLVAAPANAQATRTWVSGVGDDANPCSRTAPCKTFAGAISKTAPAGEINVLDPGGFGGVTITKSITISSAGFEAGVLVSGTNGINVSAGVNDVVVLEGLDIEGLGTGLDGIKVFSGLRVYVLRCKIHHFTNSGINMVSSTAGARMIVKDSIIFENGTQAVANTGGLTVQGGGGVQNVVEIIDTLLQNNLNYGVQVTGAANTAAFLRTAVTPTGIVSVTSGNLASIGPSNFFASGAPNQPVINFQ